MNRTGMGWFLETHSEMEVIGGETFGVASSALQAEALVCLYKGATFGVVSSALQAEALACLYGL